MSRENAAQPVTLTPLQTLAMVGAGIFFWFVGIWLIRWVGSIGGLTNDWTPLVYALVLAGTAPLLAWTQALLGVSRLHRLPVAMVIAATAACIDGVVVRWFGWVYFDDPLMQARAGAILLWAIGVLCLLGLVMSRPAARG